MDAATRRVSYGLTRLGPTLETATSLLNEEHAIHSGRSSWIASIDVYSVIDVDVRLEVLGDTPPDSEPQRQRPAVELVRVMLERELEALATVRHDGEGLRLRVLMRMADQVLAAR